jgi:methylmalonyl-CoA/ethylmalonyl-CoA epimerase
MIKKISHIGIVVKDLDKTLRVYEKVFGLTAEKIVTTSSSKLAFIPVADGEIELIQPLNPSSRSANFLSTHGEGIHHIAFETDDIENEIVGMEKKGVKMRDEKPRIGAHGVKIAFISPESTNGVITELIEKT